MKLLNKPVTDIILDILKVPITTGMKNLFQRRVVGGLGRFVNGNCKLFVDNCSLL